MNDTVKERGFQLTLDGLVLAVGFALGILLEYGLLNRSREAAIIDMRMRLDAAEERLETSELLTRRCSEEWDAIQGVQR